MTKRGLPARLLPDAEASENLAEQLIGADPAGDAAQCIVGQPQFLGEQLEHHRAPPKHRGARFEMLRRRTERLDMAGSRCECRFAARIASGNVQEPGAQTIDSFAGQRRNRDPLLSG